MRKVTQETSTAFMAGRPCKVSNTESNGTELFLFGNKIAEWRGTELWITNAGWETNTTKDRLNSLDGVSISCKKGVWYLNGTEWNGQWTRVSDGANDVKENPFKSLLMVTAIGDILCEKKEDQNKWKQRMMKAGLGENVSFPDDWDTLSEEEKERRLNGALEQLK